MERAPQFSREKASVRMQMGRDGKYPDSRSHCAKPHGVVQILDMEFRRTGDRADRLSAGRVATSSRRREDADLSDTHCYLRVLSHPADGGSLRRLDTSAARVDASVPAALHIAAHAHFRR